MSSSLSSEVPTFLNHQLYLYYLIGQPLLPEICFGPVTFQVNIHTLLVTSLAKWDQAKQVHSRVFLTTAIWLSSSLFPNLPNLSPRHQPCDHNQVLRLDLKIILPLLATSTFVFITVAAVSDFSCITQKILSAHVLHKWHLSVKFKSKIKC